MYLFKRMEFCSMNKILFYICIGYGASAPTTIAGKIFLIFFGLIGCSAAILLFNLFLERVITLIAYVFHRCYKEKLWSSRQTAATSQPKAQEGGTACGNEIWKPSLYHVTLILMAVCFLVACSASGLYSAVEGWSFLESMYFCFVTFSTIGFGDMVSGHDANCFYQIANILVIFFGVCCTYSLLTLIAFMIKAMLNWILCKVLCLNCCSEAGLKKHKCVQICCSCFMRPKVEESRQLPKAASCFSQHWSCHVVKLSTGECRCAASVLQTVCQGEMHITEKKVICEHKVSQDHTTENSLHITSLPEVMGGVAMLDNYLQETSLGSLDTIPFKGHQTMRTSTEQFHWANSKITRLKVLTEKLLNCLFFPSLVVCICWQDLPNILWADRMVSCDLYRSRHDSGLDPFFSMWMLNVMECKAKKNIILLQSVCVFK